MIATSNRNRQVAYSVGILALFGVMFFYTEWLHNLKDRRQLGEATIGQVDAGSFMLKLALLGGARGVAANVLWNRALDLQKVHDWDRLKLTVDQITKLQPHFLRVWSWQGWNLAYNVSVEWDAPEDKYEWIKQGINFLKEGVRKNEASPDLMWDTAWTYYQKIGVADEAIILRRLFHDDDDEEFRSYVDPETGQRHTPQDNFLLGYGWFIKAVDLVDRGAQRAAARFEAPVEYVDRVENRKGHPGDLHFRSMPAGSLTKYAASLEKASTLNLPPTFSERARREWERAKDAWQTFGDHPFPAHNDSTLMIYLDDAIKPSLAPGRLGWRLAGNDAGRADNQQYWTDRWAQNTHYHYWKDRCLAEMDPRGVKARRLFYEGTHAAKGADFLESVKKFQEGLATWKELLDEHPTYRDDGLNQQDTGRVMLGYEHALSNAGMKPPEDMPFADLLKAAQVDSNPDPFSQDDVQVATPGQDSFSAKE